jgi:hypothetical protein
VQRRASDENVSVVQSTPPMRPHPSALGFHRLTALCVSLQLGTLTLVVLGFRATALSFTFGPAVPILVGLLLAAWGYYVWMPGREAGDWLTAETFLVLALVIGFEVIVGPGQYPAAAWNRPLIDPWLAAIDRALGVHLPTITAWTGAQPTLTRFLSRAYITLLPQLFLPAFILGFWYRDRESLWEYAFHFHVAMVVTLACFALWPAEAPFGHYGYTSLLQSQSRFSVQFAALRAGTLTQINPHMIEGLVSCPSFHVAAALIVTWAFRRHWPWLVVLVPLNLALTLSTVLLGVHYVADLLASGVMLAGSWLAWRSVRSWMTSSGTVPVFHAVHAPQTRSITAG